MIIKKHYLIVQALYYGLSNICTCVKQVMSRFLLNCVGNTVQQLDRVHAQSTTLSNIKSLGILTL